MTRVSKWEIAGLPAAVAFGAAHRLGLFDRLGITAEELPDLMLLTFIGVATLRLVGQWWLAKKAKEDG